MKYILDGDLPHVLAGAELRISDGHLLVDAKDFILDGMLEKAGNGISGLVLCAIEDIPELVSNGWITEVREPREWYFNENSNGNMSYLYDSRAQATGMSKGRKIIKVREVIEE